MLARAVAAPFLAFVAMILTLLALGSTPLIVAADDVEPATAAITLSLDDFCLEAEAIDALSDDVLAAATPASLQAAVSAAMMRGWFDLCKNMILKGRERKVDFTSVVYQTKSKINSQLKAMTNAIRGQAVSTVSPAFEWAQSDDVVVVNVKLAHKLDTPATLDCKSTDKMITFGEGSDGDSATTAYTFRAECQKSAKNFLLHLKLWGAVVPEGSTWEYGSVGRVSIRLQKAETGKRWPKLLDDKVKRPSNMHTWWKMQAKFDDASKNTAAASSSDKKAGGTKAAGVKCKHANDCAGTLVCRDTSSNHVLVEKQTCQGTCRCTDKQSSTAPAPAEAETSAEAEAEAEAEAATEATPEDTADNSSDDEGAEATAEPSAEDGKEL